MSKPDNRATTNLRAVEPDDLEFTRLARADPNVHFATLGRRFPTTPFGERGWYERLGSGRFPTSAVWCMVDGAGARVGLVQLDDIDWINRTAWFGIWVSPDAQGHGHGRRGTEAALAKAYDSFALRQVRLFVIAENSPARKIYDAIGFVEEGTLEGAVILPDGPNDLILMRHDRPISADR